MVFAVLQRFALLAAYVLAWKLWNPTHCGDWLAFSALLPIVAARALNRRPPIEAYALAAIGLLWWAHLSVDAGPRGLNDPADWRGWGAVTAWGALAFTSSTSLRYVLGILFSVLAAVYATRVTHMLGGWRPVTVTWSMLGFLLVSAGLWRRFLTLRVCGFLLILLALIKVFAVDVWEFTAFTRVVSFIVLGLCLLLLGLFYHRFVPALRGWIQGEDDATPEKRDPP
jgi:uncharacterized membrane protein